MHWRQQPKEQFCTSYAMDPRDMDHRVTCTVPVLTMYTMQVHQWLGLDFSLVNITDFTLSRLICFTFTA